MFKTIKPILLLQDTIATISLDEIVEKYKPFIYKTASECIKKIKKNNLLIELDDLVQECYIGLIKAYQSYNIKNNVTFGHYLKICIRNEICVFLRRTIQYNKKYNSSQYSFIHLEQLVENCDTPTEYGNFLPDPNCITENDITNTLFIKDALNELSFRERKIIHEIYVLNKNQNDIAHDLNISQSSVSQIKCLSLSKLKEKLA